MLRSTIGRIALGCAMFGLVFFLASSAKAYPWMIRHEYTGCATCHTDPSGGGLLTPYGRAQAALLLSSRLGTPASAEGDEPPRYKDFGFGVPLPEFLDVQTWTRGAYLANVSRGEVVDKRFLLMRADAGAHVHVGAFRASGMLGVATPDSKALTQQAWVTHSPDGVNLVSREHWIGGVFADDSIWIRAGRLSMPFGLRNPEHTTWVRQETRSDTNQQQQHGVSVALSGEKIRAEGMLVLGNYQINPDDYRERGYSGFAEYVVAPRLAAGISSSILHANADFVTRRGIIRQAHGLFGRYSPTEKLVLLAEADLLVRSIRQDNPSVDVAGLVQADYEAFRGIHFVANGELLTVSRSGGARAGGWLSAWVFLFAHMDARADLIFRTAPDGPSTTTFLMQLHGWL